MWYRSCSTSSWEVMRIGETALETENAGNFPAIQKLALETVNTSALANPKRS